MSIEMSDFQKVLNFAGVVNATALTEGIYENDASGNPIYVGIALTPGADENAPIWYIYKVEYDAGGFPIRKKLPLGGRHFIYKWSDRATLFA